MPELPEVEVLVQHLTPQLLGKTIRGVQVLDPRSIRQSTPTHFKDAVSSARFQSLRRRGKYLHATMRKSRRSFPLIAHLGMTGRLYLSRRSSPTARHATVLLELGREHLVFEDVRRFGGMTLNPAAIGRLGPEPLEPGFTAEVLGRALAGSRQAIKVKLLDQSVVAGIGNIYASEALFMAHIDPRTPSQKLTQPTIQRLRTSIRRVLSHAIRFGSTVPLDFGGQTSNTGLFYYGQSSEHSGHYIERLRVYDREGGPCRRCGSAIRKAVQAGRSTYFCSHCQH